MRLVRFLILAFCLLPLWADGAMGRAVPPAQGSITDLAAMISPAGKEELSRTLAEFERSDSTQIAILTLDSLEGEALEDFAIRVAEQWGIGQKGKDNGILLLVAKQERKVRIEVGRGLEGALTDLLAGRIVDLVIAPSFKAGRFDQGFVAGVDAIIAATRGEFQAEKKGGGRHQDAPPVLSYLFVALLLLAFLGSLSKKLGMVGGAALLPLAVYFGIGGALSLLLLLALIPAGALAGLLAPYLLRLGLIGGFHSGGGFGSGGSGGFGGFGGGGFGGGGASGSW